MYVYFSISTEAEFLLLITNIRKRWLSWKRTDDIHRCIIIYLRKSFFLLSLTLLSRQIIIKCAYTMLSNVYLQRIEIDIKIFIVTSVVFVYVSLLFILASRRLSVWDSALTYDCLFLSTHFTIDEYSAVRRYCSSWMLVNFFSDTSKIEDFISEILNHDTHRLIGKYQQ